MLRRGRRRKRPGREICACACAALAWIGPAPGAIAADASAPEAPPAAAELQLAGTWHVLIHYRDASGPNPEAWHWDERVWIFEIGADALRWTEYPIVLFHDDRGRFESLGTQRQARVLDAWEPDESQRAQIRSGLEVNPRGRNVKELRGSDASGWRSGDPLRPTASRLVSYVEDWSIGGLPAAPVFTQTDLMGSSDRDSLEGVTRYATEELRAGRDDLRGSFTRDGNRRGRFQMRRAGPVQSVGERSQQEIRKRVGAPLP